MTYLDTVLRDLRQERTHWKAIARLAQVSPMTITNMAAGITPDPRVRTLQRIEAAIATMRSIRAEAKEPAASDEKGAAA